LWLFYEIVLFNSSLKAIPKGYPGSRAGMTMMFKGRNIPVIPEAA
jgi:hypothetical protein